MLRHDSNPTNFFARMSLEATPQTYQRDHTHGNAESLHSKQEEREKKVKNKPPFVLKNKLSVCVHLLDKRRGLLKDCDQGKEREGDSVQRDDHSQIPSLRHEYDRADDIKEVSDSRSPLENFGYHAVVHVYYS